MNTAKEYRTETGTAGVATYCPEDNKLRLYVGRIEKEYWLELKAEGWKPTPKQECNFVATWSVSRRKTCFEYADLIEDEDQSPEERAADRADRFADYREKRLGEALGHADRFEAGPQAVGFQDARRAERAAAKLDRVADRATDAWGKAEYWTRRTEGVIANALHLSSPSVRLGRIKTIETDLRRVESYYTPASDDRKTWDGEEHCLCGLGRGQSWVKVSRLADLKESYAAFVTHCKLRLAYENQMLEAAGGAAGEIEMVKGGFYRGRRIHAVNKSAASGKVTSLKVWGKYRSWRLGHSQEVEGLYLLDVERDTGGGYVAPTAEDLKTFKEELKAIEAKCPSCPLVNPTLADAERLQAKLNEGLAPEYQEKVWEMTQAAYSARAAGEYGPCGTRNVCEGGTLAPRFKYGREKTPPVVCKVRAKEEGGYGFRCAPRVVVLTDKPQKPFPASVWAAPVEVTA